MAAVTCTIAYENTVCNMGGVFYKRFKYWHTAPSQTAIFPIIRK